MKNLLKKILAGSVLMAIMAGAAACQMVETDVEAVKKLVVANVNGEDILNADWRAIYEQYYNYAVQMGIDPSTESGQKQLEEFKTYALDAAISSVVWEQAAKKEGFFTFTDEQRAEAKKEAEADLEKQIETLAKDLSDAVAGQEGMEGKDFVAMAREQVERDMAAAGVTLDTLTQEKLEADALDNYKQAKIKDVKPLEADIFAKYDELKKSQTESITSASTYVSAFQKGDIMIVNREGYKLVQHILISFSTADKTAISELTSDITDKETSITTLETSLKEEEDADKKKEIEANIATAKTELEALKKSKEEAMTAATAKVQEEADAILASVQGADEAKFIEIMLEKTTDTGMNTEEAAKRGYLVGESDNMVTSFHDAGLALKEDGEISGFVPSDYGLHIIRKMKDVKSGTAALEDVREAITASLTTTQQSEAWTKHLETITKDAKITRNKKNLIY